MSDIAAEEVTLLELIQMAIDAHMLDVHVSLPARVESFDASKQTVEITIMINRMVSDGATPPNWVSEQMPKLKDVPVAFPRGGGFFMSLPLQQGDPGMLIFAERPLGAWRSTGGQGDPGDLGMHTLDGAYFIPATAPDKAALQSVSDTNMVIGKDDASSGQIEITPGGEIHLGTGATKGIVREGDDLSASAAMSAWAAAVEAALSSLSAPVATPFATAAGLPGGLGATHGASSTEKAAD
jgi:hypothetical protein